MDRLLVLYADALGPSQLALAPRLQSLLPYRRVADGMAGFSSGAIATVLTGASPKEHGRLCLFSARAAGARSPLDSLSWLGLLPSWLNQRRVVRRAAERWLEVTSGMDGYLALHRANPRDFSWLDLPEREDILRADAIGGARTFLSLARERGLSVYASPWQLDEDARWQATLASSLARPASLTFAYSSALDAALHSEGNDRVTTVRALDLLAARLESLLEVLSRGGATVRVLVAGDHGMADVHRAVDPWPVLARRGSVRAFVDSTMARFWGNATALEALRAACERARWPGRWLDGGGLASEGVPTEGSTWGDAWWLLEEGAIFAPSHVGGLVRGMHGYGPTAPSARPALASNGPLGDVRRLDDIAGYVLGRLGVSS
jgi:hypothetical protein